MARPSKPVSILESEKKSHRTKAELAQRKKAEEAVLSNSTIKERQEVKDNVIAHKEFLRVTKLLDSIEKNDALYENIINRYCMIQAECSEFEDKIKELNNHINSLNIDNFGDDADFYKTCNELNRTILSIDKQLQNKRKMLFDIEKENIMTIASALRTVPKKESKQENTLDSILNGVS